MLEKSRIVSHGKGERNYHVFYELLSGLKSKEKEEYALSQPEDFLYLSKGGSYEVPGKKDEEDFHRMCTAMEVLGIKVL